jgi:hypothetical protein
LIALDKRLPAVLKGADRPKAADEVLEFAAVCYFKQLYGTASRLYVEAFTAKPALARTARFRHEAAWSAARAGCWQGRDAAALDDNTRGRWRNQALAWLREDLALLTRQAETDSAQTRRTLRRWQAERELAGVREPAELARLPEGERKAWAKFWAEVAALRDASEVLEEMGWSGAW